MRVKNMETTIISSNLILIIKTIILAVALYVAYCLGRLSKEEELKQKALKQLSELLESIDEIELQTKQNTQTDLIKNHGKTVKVVRNSKGRFAKKS